MTSLDQSDGLQQSCSTTSSLSDEESGYSSLHAYPVEIMCLKSTIMVPSQQEFQSKSFLESPPKRLHSSTELVDRNDDSSHVIRDSNVQRESSQEACFHRFNFQPNVIVTWLSILSFIALGVGLRFGLKSGDRGASSSVGNGQNGTDPKECYHRLEHEFTSGQNPDVFQQCACLQSIQYMQPSASSRYDEIRGVIVDSVLSDVDDERESCSSQNQAIAMLSIQSGQDTNREELITRYALAVLFISLGGENWNFNSLWLSSDYSFCDWYGIQCRTENVSKAEITSIILRENGLRGSIPSEISIISSLMNLDLSSNTITSTLPESIGSLNRISNLNLSSNKLTGSITSSISSLSKLTSLDLGRNTLSMEIPTEIGLLENLEMMRLETNILKGPIPTEIGKLRNLKTLNLNLCNLMGKIPTELGDITNLEVLWLENNGLSDIPTQIGNLRKLRLLSISMNLNLGLLPTEIGHLSSLVAIVIESGGITGTIPEEVSSLSDLLILDLGNNQLTGSIPPMLFSMQKLEVLRFRANSLSGDVNLDNFTAPNCIDVSENKEISQIQESFCPVISSENALVISSCESKNDPCSCCTCGGITSDICYDRMVQYIRDKFM